MDVVDLNSLMTTGVQPEGVVLLCLGHSSCSDALLESAVVTSCLEFGSVRSAHQVDARAIVFALPDDLSPGASTNKICPYGLLKQKHRGRWPLAAQLR